MSQSGFFPLFFFIVLYWFGIGVASLSVVGLIVLFLRDLIRKRLW